MKPDLILVFDGGSKGNPGFGYGSYMLMREGKRTLTRLEFGDGVTNNEAEYDTLITALEALTSRMDASRLSIEVRSDSQLVVSQIKGNWKAKEPRMRARRDRARDLLRRFKDYRLVRVPRAQIVKLLGH